MSTKDEGPRLQLRSELETKLRDWIKASSLCEMGTQDIADDLADVLFDASNGDIKLSSTSIE